MAPRAPFRLPRRGFRRRLAGGDGGAHLHQHVVGGDRAGGDADRAAEAAPEGAVHGIGEDLDLRVGFPDRALPVGVQRLAPVADAAGEPGVVLLGLQHEGEEGLGGIGVAGVPEDHGVQHRRGMRRGAGEALRHRRVVGVLGDGAGRRIGLQGEVQRDAVRGEEDVLRGEGAVVRDIEPGERAVHEGRVELPQVVQRIHRLAAVDGDLAFLIDQHPAMRPDQPLGEGIAVADRIAEGEADRLVVALQPLAEPQEARVVLRDGVEAGSLHGRTAVGDRADAAAEGDAEPGLRAVLLAVLLRQEGPAAVAGAEVFGDVGHLDQLVGVDMRVVGPADDHVRAAAGIGGDRGLRPDILPADEIDPDGDVEAVLEGLGVAAEDHLVRLDEAGGADDAEAGAGLRRQAGCGDVAAGDGALAEGGGGKCRGAEGERRPAGQFVHGLFLPGIGFGGADTGDPGARPSAGRMRRGRAGMRGKAEWLGGRIHEAAVDFHDLVVDLQAAVEEAVQHLGIHLAPGGLHPGGQVMHVDAVVGEVGLQGGLHPLAFGRCHRCGSPRRGPAAGALRGDDPAQKPRHVSNPLLAKLHLDRPLALAIGELVHHGIAAAGRGFRPGRSRRCGRGRSWPRGADPPGAGHVVGDGDRGRAELLHAIDDQPVDDRAHDGVEAGRRLVEEDDVGLGGDGAGQADALLHAARELGRGKVADRRGEADLGQHLGRLVARLGPGDAVLRQQLEADVLPDRQAVEERAVLEQHADAVAQRLPLPPRQLQDVDAVDLDRALVGLDQPEDAFDGDGLAGAGAAEDDEALPGRDVEVDAIQHLLAAEGLLHAAHADFGTAVAVAVRFRPPVLGAASALRSSDLLLIARRISRSARSRARG